MQSMKDKVIIALDAMNRSQALDLARTLSGEVWGFKVNDLLLQYGVEVIRELKKLGHVFADPKLYDIPNTVANGVRELAAAGADLITVHASGGKKMLARAAEAAGASRILAVTVLTSFDDAGCSEVYGRPAAKAVNDLATLSASSGVHGIVCSPQELDDVRQFGALMKVTPGIRPSWHGRADDQVRTLTPQQAVERGASYIVVGRPVTEHEDPPRAVRSLFSDTLT